MRSQTSGFVRARLSRMQRGRETKAVTTAKIFGVASDSSYGSPLALNASSSYLMAHMTKSEAYTLTRKVKGRRLVLKRERERNGELCIARSQQIHIMLF